LTSKLPPGPKKSMKTSMQWFRAPATAMQEGYERYGDVWLLSMQRETAFVLVSDPDLVKQVFTADPAVLRGGEANAQIGTALMGKHSLILLDEGPHMEQRKLLLPAFHGERMHGLRGLMQELTERELASWPRGEAIELHPRLQRLTLEIVLRAVFGLERGARLDELRDLLTGILKFTENPLSLLPPPPGWVERAMAGRGPLGRLEASLAQADALIFELIDERRREDAHGPDVLTMLLGAEHEDGSPMSPAELRDELVTALVAGHETTASQLAWGFELLARNPRVTQRLSAELDADPDSPYLTATIHEIMRRRPVLMNAEPRLVKQQVEIGGVSYPPGVVLIASAYLVHHDPDIYPQPYAFRPERFLESEGGKAPGTYTWLPFGGGRRRCLGASFAMLEMKIVLRQVIERNLVLPVGDRPERARRRSITISPSRGCEVVLRARPKMSAESEPVVREKVAALATA